MDFAVANQFKTKDKHCDTAFAKNVIEKLRHFEQFLAQEDS